MMSNNSYTSPIFPIQPFTDYGFDPQIHYFQVLEEARKHKRDTCSSRSAIDSLHFKLQKPISKDDKKIKKSRKRWWWKNAFHFFKRSKRNSDDNTLHCLYGGAGVRAVSGPVYLAESHSRPSSASGPLHIPYINLGEFNRDEMVSNSNSPNPMPIYLVT